MVTARSEEWVVLVEAAKMPQEVPRAIVQDEDDAVLGCISYARSGRPAPLPDPIPHILCGEGRLTAPLPCEPRDQAPPRSDVVLSDVPHGEVGVKEQRAHGEQAWTTAPAWNACLHVRPHSVEHRLGTNDGLVFGRRTLQVTDECLARLPCGRIWMLAPTMPGSRDTP
jgi:hypothetical protein